MTNVTIDRFTALPAFDRRLLLTMSGAALIALVLGILGGLLTALARGGFIDVGPETAYRFLTVHGVSIFFYWLYIDQAALLLGFAAIEDDRCGLAWCGIASAGFLAMIVGFFFSMLTLLAALAVMLPALSGRRIAWPSLLRLMPWLATAGLLLFGGAGVAAGYLGVPRRVIEIFYDGKAPALWQELMAAVAVGGALMAFALFVYAVGVAASLVPRRTRTGGEPASLTVAWGGLDIRPGAAAWVGPVSVLTIVAAMYVFTAIGFELMQGLPFAAVGGRGH